MSHKDRFTGLRDDTGSVHPAPGSPATTSSQLNPTPALSVDHFAIMSLRLQTEAHAAHAETAAASSPPGSNDIPAPNGTTPPINRARDNSPAVDDDTETLAALPPIDRSRIEDWLNSHGHYYFVDTDGDVGTIMRHRIFFIRLLGPSRDILQIRGCWNHSLSVVHAASARNFCNAYNRDTVLQKVFVRVGDTGEVSFFCEIAMDLRHGIYDAQLQNFINSGLGSGASFFDKVDSQFAHLT